MRVRVINSLPVNGEEEILDLIGREFEVYDAEELTNAYCAERMKENGEVFICTCRTTDEYIALNRNEYEIID